jgi:hypothetical protein
MRRSDAALHFDRIISRYATRLTKCGELSGTTTGELNEPP